MHVTCVMLLKYLITMREEKETFFNAWGRQCAMSPPLLLLPLGAALHGEVVPAHVPGARYEVVPHPQEPIVGNGVPNILNYDYMTIPLSGGWLRLT